MSLIRLPCHYACAYVDMCTDIYRCLYVQDCIYLLKYTEDSTLRKRHNAGQRYFIHVT